jgi:succinate dehydrogenase hydrophobic anchor subunit
LAVSLRVVIDLTLLGLAIFHGVNGVRTIVLDFGVGIQSRRFLSAALVILGMAGLLFGVYGVWPMLIGG